MITTVDDMYQYCLERLNKENSLFYRPAAFDIDINPAQQEWVENRYFEYDRFQKRMDDLRVISVPPTVIANTGVAAPEEEIFAVPYDDTVGAGVSYGYWHMLSVEVKVNYQEGECGPEWCMGRVLRRDQRTAIKTDPFNRPSTENGKVFYWMEGNNVRVWLGVGTVSYADEVKVEYLRYPIPIVLGPPATDCELPVHARKEICDIVVRRKLESMESPRYQSNAIEMSQSNE